MVHDSVAFPEPRPEDDEDVVWGLSTATALWARGERTDAIVWIRRAADAAEAAGQSFRSSELGLFAASMEDALEAPPESVPDTLVEDQSPFAVIGPGLPPPAAREEPRERDSGDRATLDFDEDRATPPRGFPAVQVPPAGAPAALLQAEITKSSKLVAPPPGFVAAPHPVFAPGLPSAPHLVAAPVSVAAPHSAAAPVSVAAPHSAAAPVSVVAPHSTAAPVSVAAPRSAAARSVRPPASETARRQPRGPILDPWSDDPASVASAAANAPREKREDLVVNLRSRPGSSRSHEDAEEVVTSAAPLDATLKRRPAPPRSAPPGKAPPKPEPVPGHLPKTAEVPPKPVRAAAPPPPVELAVESETVAVEPEAEIVAVEPEAVAVEPEAVAVAVEPEAVAVKQEAVAVEVPPAPLSLRPTVGNILLDGVDAFADLSAEAQQELAGAARVETLAADEEVSGFGGALLIAGSAAVCATIVDSPACRASIGALVPSRGSLVEGVGLRVVAGEGGAKVALWEQPILDAALAAVPWIVEGLLARSDRMQALAGATMGALGDLDEPTRTQLLGRLAVRRAEPMEIIAERGKPVESVLLVGAGAIEIDPGSTARPGDVLFSRELIEGLPAPHDARAGAMGALLLVGSREIADEASSNAALQAFLRGGD